MNSRSWGIPEEERHSHPETFLRSHKFFANSSTHAKYNLLSSRSAFADLLSLLLLKTNYYSLSDELQAFPHGTSLAGFPLGNSEVSLISVNLGVL